MAVTSMVIGGLGVATYNFISDNKEDQKKEADYADTPNNFSQDIPDKENNLAKTYKITDDKSFRQLYEASLPIAQLSLFSTEILVLDPYSDNGGQKNTIGLGSYWYPVNGDPYSSEWISTQTYIKQHSDLKLTGDDALKLTDGWCRYREDGRIYKAMYKELKGCELKPYEFAAIFSRIYNSEKYGLEVCGYVRKNYKDPIKCAHKIMCFKPAAKFEDGIIKRDASEALLYLNYNDYANKICNLQVKEGINSKGNKYFVSSITQLKPEDCEKMRQGLSKKDLSAADMVCHKIIQYIPKGGRNVRKIIHDEIKDKQVCQNLLTYTSSDIDFVEANADNDYKLAMEKYNEKDYQGALELMQKVVKQGFVSADIHNDIAITQYHLGNYDECISECRKVLATGESEFYAAANFNAGLAYEQKGDTAKALVNYELAQSRKPDVKAYKIAVKRLSASKTDNKDTKNIKTAKTDIKPNNKKSFLNISKSIISARKGIRGK